MSHELAKEKKKCTARTSPQRLGAQRRIFLFFELSTVGALSFLSLYECAHMWTIRKEKHKFLVPFLFFHPANTQRTETHIGRIVKKKKKELRYADKELIGRCAPFFSYTFRAQDSPRWPLRGRQSLILEPKKVREEISSLVINWASISEPLRGARKCIRMLGPVMDRTLRSYSLNLCSRPQGQSFIDWPWINKELREWMLRNV